MLSNDDAGVGHCTILIFQRNGNKTKGAATGDKSKQDWLDSFQYWDKVLINRNIAGKIAGGESCLLHNQEANE